MFRRVPDHAFVRWRRQHHCGAGQTGRIEFARDEVALATVMTRHDQLIAVQFDHIPHHVNEGGGVNDVVMLQRIVEQQRAPA
jgi:hypothetical protein